MEWLYKSIYNQLVDIYNNDFDNYWDIITSEINENIDKINSKLKLFNFKLVIFKS